MTDLMNKNRTELIEALRSYTSKEELDSLLPASTASLRAHLAYHLSSDEDKDYFPRAYMEALRMQEEWKKDREKNDAADIIMSCVRRAAEDFAAMQDRMIFDGPGETIPQEEWNLEAFKRNPILLRSHGRRSFFTRWLDRRRKRKMIRAMVRDIRAGKMRLEPGFGPDGLLVEVSLVKK